MKNKTATLPDFINQSHIDYLDALRDGGTTNMFSAWKYLVAEFDISKQTATQIFTHWIRHCH